MGLKVDESRCTERSQLRWFGKPPNASQMSLWGGVWGTSIMRRHQGISTLKGLYFLARLGSSKKESVEVATIIIIVVI